MVRRGCSLEFAAKRVASSESAAKVRRMDLPHTTALPATRWIWNLRPTAVPSYLALISVEEREWVGSRLS
jgi:hypothetical protein